MARNRCEAVSHLFLKKDFYARFGYKARLTVFVLFTMARVRFYLCFFFFQFVAYRIEFSFLGIEI